MLRQAQSEKMTFRVAPDVRDQLDKWAKERVSNMTTELNRVVRELAAREAREKAAS